MRYLRWDSAVMIHLLEGGFKLLVSAVKERFVETWVLLTSQNLLLDSNIYEWVKDRGEGCLRKEFVIEMLIQTQTDMLVIPAHFGYHVTCDNKGSLTLSLHPKNKISCVCLCV